MPATPGWLAVPWSWVSPVASQGVRSAVCAVGDASLWPVVLGARGAASGAVSGDVAESAQWLVTAAVGAPGGSPWELHLTVASGDIGAVG